MRWLVWAVLALVGWSGVNIAGYYVFLDGSQVADVSASPYSYAGIDCGTTSTFGAKAHHGSGRGRSRDPGRRSGREHTSPMFQWSYASPGCCPVSNGNQAWQPSRFTGTSSNGKGEYKYAPVSDSQALACATALGGDTLERRNVNTQFNRYLPSSSELSAFESTLNSHGQTPTQFLYYPKFVTGGCAAGQGGHPTTDFLIDCTAYKWGIPADWLRAQYVKESGWRMTQLGDLASVRCYDEYPSQARVPPSSVYQSMGISQIKWTCDRSDSAGTELLRWKSTAFNMDYEASVVRFEYDNPNGDRSSWGDSGYRPQQQWLSLCAWYGGYPWNNSGQQSYCSAVHKRLANRQWLSYTG